jgi:hypothetical protein
VKFEEGSEGRGLEAHWRTKHHHDRSPLDLIVRCVESGPGGADDVCDGSLSRGPTAGSRRRRDASTPRHATLAPGPTASSTPRRLLPPPGRRPARRRRPSPFRTPVFTRTQLTVGRVTWPASRSGPRTSASASTRESLFLLPLRGCAAPSLPRSSASRLSLRGPPTSLSPGRPGPTTTPAAGTLTCGPGCPVPTRRDGP